MVSSRLHYPDPFQPTGIEFTLEGEAVVTATILDGWGKEIETLIDRKPFAPGKHVIPFDTAKYKTGDYWYKISVNISGSILIDTKKIL